VWLAGRAVPCVGIRSVRGLPNRIQHPARERNARLKKPCFIRAWRRQTFAASLGYLSLRLADYTTTIVNQQTLFWTPENDSTAAAMASWNCLALPASEMDRLP